MNDRSALLIGIDDTDNLDTRGTGFRARQLSEALEAGDLASTAGITRHQLLVDDRIPYTSHNSSACLQVSVRSDIDTIHAFCRDYMLNAAAEGSDVGLCLASPEGAATAVGFGLSAKTEVLDQGMARTAAATAGVRLEGLTGSRGGIIGALAGVALYVQGDDGRYIWLPHIRSMDNACITIADLIEKTGIDAVAEIEGAELSRVSDARVALGEWPRAVRVAGRSVLLVKRSDDESADFEVLAKDRIKAFRP